jgi:hypothetical protein
MQTIEDGVVWGMIDLDYRIYLLRKIVSLEDQRHEINNALDDLNRKLMMHDGMPVNDQDNYGGNIHPEERGIPSHGISESYIPDM